MLYPLLSLKGIPSILRADVDADHKGLTRGSFTDAHLSLLDTIRFAGQVMPSLLNDVYREDIAYPREALQQGIKVALTTINPRAVDILLKIDYYFCYFEIHLYYTIPSDHFRTAALTYINLNKRENEASNIERLEKMRSYACLLLYSSAESVPWISWELQTEYEGGHGPHGACHNLAQEA